MGISLKSTNIAIEKYDFRKTMKNIIPRRDYLTHGIHPYTAKLIPHIPRYFIGKYTQKNEIILDLFCGSGTTLLEAVLLSRNTIGIDINPLATLISKIKTTPLESDNLSSAIRLVKERMRDSKGRVLVDFPNKDYWFCKKAQTELSKIKESIDSLNCRFNEDIYNFLLICFSTIIRKSSYADLRIAKTYKSKRVIKKIRKGWEPTPIQYFEESLDRNFERIKAFSEQIGTNDNFVKIFQGDSKETSVILKQNKIREVDFIITSPPYINAQDYFRSYKLELWWLGLVTPEDVGKLNKQAIGNERISGCNYTSPPKSPYPLLNKKLNKTWKINKQKSYIIYNYFQNIEQVLKESYKVLKVGGYLCLVTGSNTICEILIPTYEILIQIAENNGFKLVELGRDEIKNRALPPKRNHSGGIIKEEWITVFQKRG